MYTYIYIFYMYICTCIYHVIMYIHVCICIICMVYDEGFEVRLGKRIFFAFSNFTFESTPQASRHNVSHCGDITSKRHRRGQVG